MKEDKDLLYGNLQDSMTELFSTDPYYEKFMDTIKASNNSFYIYDKKIEKEVDLAWIEAIEDTIIPIDNVIRNPRRTIEINEELLPMELSRNISPDSVKHLAQHTYLINDIAEDGTITPSKIMNYIKEETIQTYENKFVNTLIDRLYTFIEMRYKKIQETANDENVGVIQYDTKLEEVDGGYLELKMIIESHRKAQANLDAADDLLERVEKIRNVIMDYKNSKFVSEMQGSFVRPPIMRTNAILKNPDLKQCLVCWQFIESYDKVGYRVKIKEETKKPTDEYVSDIYKLNTINYAMFKHFMLEELGDAEVLQKRENKKKIEPKFIKKMINSVVANYDVGQLELKTMLKDALEQNNIPDNQEQIESVRAAIDRVLKIEEDYRQREIDAIKQRKRELAEEIRRKSEESERRRLELLEEERRAKEEERLAQEAEERRIALEEAARKRAQEEEERRKQREIEEAIERQKRAELLEKLMKERIAREKAEQEYERRKEDASAIATFAQSRRKKRRR